MPPPSSKLPAFDGEERALLRKWIENGARFERHWSFDSLPDEVPVPTVQARDRVRNAIDSFVLASLEKQSLAPAGEASRSTLLRRLSFDLTGLGPTPRELDEFLADESPQAYARAVQRLLASPRFGERMASPWLDSARYADTHGYQADRYRAVWPWRDWVVRAFNENLSYRDFVTWQLAGDLIPNATRDQKLATAFNRLHRQTEEGGTIEEEFRVEYVADRVDTFGTAFLGLTLGCARCHDHKFDPISQREYYELFAFFQNIDESGQTSHFTDAIPVPTLLLPDEASEKKLATLAGRIVTARTAFAAARAASAGAFRKWLEQPTRPTTKGPIAEFTFAKPDKKRVRIGEAKRVPTPNGTALRLNGDSAIQLLKTGDFRRTDPFSITTRVHMPKTAKRAIVFHKTKAALDAASRGYELRIDEGRLFASLVHMWPHNAIAVRTRSKLPTRRWARIVLTYDGSSRADGLRIYVDGRLQVADVVRDNLTKDILYERGGAPNLQIGARFRDRGLDGGLVGGLAVFDRALTAIEVRELSQPGAIDAALRAKDDSLRELYVAHVDAEVRVARKALRNAREEHSKAIQRISEIMVMKEMTQPRPAFVLERGAYDNRGARVEAATPRSLPDFGNRPRNRLGLAQWLFDPRHPLTARVAVNRIWQLFFGKGLVTTTEDLGTQGQRPSHPQLLDWLARRFVDSGWNLKELCQLIVSSATYRQSSVADAALLARDPDNRLLARGPRHRLHAEAIRDHALHAAGLLVAKRGGAPVRPYQPAGLWREKSGQRYTPSKGEGLYRRSLYTYWKRTSPPPSMILFDMPRRHGCVVRREHTSTPLQALVLLNDPQFVEAARGIGERMLRHGGNRRQQLAFAFQLLTSRKPLDAETQVLERLFAEQLALFTKDDKAAAALLGVGAKKADPKLARPELAAATAVANALLSFDESVMKR